MPNSFAQLYAMRKARHQTHLTFPQLLAAFDLSYDELDIPLALCEGLEIIAHNTSFQHVASATGLTPNTHGFIGQLLNAMVPEQAQIELLFRGEGSQADITLNNRTVTLSVQPWQYNRKLWLLHWNDQTYLNNLHARLGDARKNDPITGTLLPAAFQRQTRLSLGLSKHSLMLLIELKEKPLCRVQFTDELADDTLLAITETLRLELDETSIIGRPNSTTLSILTPTDGEAEEHRHILRQVNRTAIKIAAPHKVHVGAACYPASAQNADDLYLAAKLAKEEAHKGQAPRLFTKELVQAAERREQLAADMPEAIRVNEITPFFQPVIHAQSGQIKGFEALIRWFHPTLGFVTPPHIIEIAQETEMLHIVTAHVLQETVKQMQQWPSTVQFAVNVTPTQLTSELVDLVRSVIRSAQVDPSRLEIEVTEDALIADFCASAKIFARLRAIGVSVAMDDFGAGYTSMSNLRTLDFTKIKIDKSISDGLPDDKKSIAIMKSLMFMAGELGVDITVEGIETEEQLALLQPFNCGVQGYVFAKPMPIKDLQEMKKFLAPAVVIDAQPSKQITKQ